MLKRFLQQHKMVVIADQAIFSATSFLLTLFLAWHLSIADFGLYSGILLGLYLFVSLQSAFVIQPFQVNIAKAPSLQVYSSFIFWFQVTGMAAVALLSYGSRFIWAGNEVVSPGFWLFAFGFGLHDFFRKMLLARRMIQGAFYFDVIVAIGILAAIAVLFSSTNLRLTAIYRALGIAYLPAIIAGVLMIRPFDNITNCWVSWAKLHFHPPAEVFSLRCSVEFPAVWGNLGC